MASSRSLAVAPRAQARPIASTRSLVRSASGLSRAIISVPHNSTHVTRNRPHKHTHHHTSLTPFARQLGQTHVALASSFLPALTHVAAGAAHAAARPGSARVSRHSRRRVCTSIADRILWNQFSQASHRIIRRSGFCGSLQVQKVCSLV